MKKPTLILPIVTAIAGFAAGWLVKPAPDAASTVAAPKPARREPASPAPTRPEPLTEPREAPARTPNLSANRKPEAEIQAQIKSVDDAKMARLTEALNLTSGQQAELLRVMTTAQATLNPEEKLDTLKMLDIAAGAGAAIEKSLASILSPEQVAALAALRERTRQNSIETNSQKQVSTFAKLIDLSPEQREKITDRIRDGVRQSYEARPQGLDLVLDTSPLPTGSTFVADSSIDSLRLLTGGPNANENIEAFRDVQRRNLDAQAEQYNDLLTPAQQAQLKLDIEERKRALDRVAEIGR